MKMDILNEYANLHTVKFFVEFRVFFSILSNCTTLTFDIFLKLLEGVNFQKKFPKKFGLFDSIISDCQL